MAPATTPCLAAASPGRVRPAASSPPAPGEGDRSGEGVTARRGDGDSTGKQAGPREATRGPLPCSRGVQASLGCTAATSSSPWVQRVCRGDTGTPARQSQPGLSIQPAGWPAPRPLTAARSAAPARGDPSLRQGLSRVGQGRGQGLPVAVAGTHNDTQTGTLATSMAASTSHDREAAGAAGGPGGCRLPVTSPAPASPSLPSPQQCGRDQLKRANHHPPKPPQRPPPRCRVIGLPAPRTGVEHGVGAEPVGHPLPTVPASSSPCWETSARATLGGALEGAAQPWQGCGCPQPPQQRAVPSAGLRPLASPRRHGGGDRHPRRYRAQPVLSFSSSTVFLFLFFFFLWETQSPVPARATTTMRSPHPCPQGGGTGRVVQMPHAAVTRRSLLLWPGPSAPCPCPAVRLSCSPCPGRLRRARGRALRSPRSGRSS